MRRLEIRIMAGRTVGGHVPEQICDASRNTKRRKPVQQRCFEWPETKRIAVLMGQKFNDVHNHIIEMAIRLAISDPRQVGHDRISGRIFDKLH